MLASTVQKSTGRQRNAVPCFPTCSSHESMPKEELLSAIAKRRRLNGSAAGGDSLNPSRSQSPAKVQILKESQNIHKNDITLDADSNPQVYNEFHALIERDIVHFSSFREIEKLNDHAIKIRLSKDQQCFISGGYSLWIKEGVIDFLGARLEASFDAHNIYATTLLEVPPILALNDAVELEVRSHREAVPANLGLNPYDWKSPADDIFSVSFFVHGYSISVNGNAPSLNKGPDTGFAKDIGQRILEVEPANKTEQAPTVLTCGKQFTGTTTPFICIVNTILTARDRTRNQAASYGVLLLDLDSDMPIMGIPGTSRLVHVRKPILGSSFNQPVMFNLEESSAPFIGITMRYEGKNTSSEQKITQLGEYLELVKDLRLHRYQKCPFVIRANSWLEYLDASQIQKLAKKILPNFVVCYGLENASHGGQLGSAIASQANALPVLVMPVINTKGPYSSIYNELMLQSYFRFRGYSHGRPRWSCLPLELGSDNHAKLTYQSRSDLASSISVPGMFLHSFDIDDVLGGCIAAVVLRNCNTTISKSGMTWQSPAHDVFRPDETKFKELSQPACLGYGIIAGLNQNENEICLLTPIPQHILDGHTKRGDKIDLVFPKADPDSGFDTAWVQLELGASSLRTKLGKAIYRRKLNVQPEGGERVVQ